VRAIEDLALLSRLKETQMTLDVCPTSNICLGVYPSLSEHPLPSLIEAGLSVTLNSDDPPMFNTTLTGEYLACQKAFGWGIDQITRLSLAGVERSLLSASEKRELKARFESELRGLRS